MPSELAALQQLLYQAVQVLTTLPEDPVLRFAVYSAMALAALTLAVMLQVLVLVLTELASRRERRRQAFTAQWRPCLAAWSTAHGDALPWPPRGKQQEIWFMLLWLRLRRQVRGPSQQRLNALFEGIGMSSRVVRLLRGRGVHRRLLSLSCLQYLADSRYWSEVSPLVDDSNSVVALSAAQTLVAMDSDRAMQRVIPLVQLRRDWALPRLEALCRQAGPASVSGPLLSQLVEGEDPPLRLAPLLVWADPNRVAPWAIRLLAEGFSAQEGREVLLCVALSCLGKRRDPRDRVLLLRWLEASSPQVRLAAVQALRRQAGPDEVSFLLERLADASWWVRQAAADALVELPSMADADIETWQQAVTDRYGQDALRRAIAERRR